jgi:hypothetical protein
MKTNRLAVWVVRIRGIVLGLALVGMASIAFSFGESLACRFGQLNACPSAATQVPALGISDLMAAAR